MSFPPPPLTYEYQGGEGAFTFYFYSFSWYCHIYPYTLLHLLTFILILFSLFFFHFSFFHFFIGKKPTTQRMEKSITNEEENRNLAQRMKMRSIAKLLLWVFPFFGIIYLLGWKRILDRDGVFIGECVCVFIEVLRGLEWFFIFCFVVFLCFVLFCFVFLCFFLFLLLFLFYFFLLLFSICILFHF